MQNIILSTKNIKKCRRKFTFLCVDCGVDILNFIAATYFIPNVCVRVTNYSNEMRHIRKKIKTRAVVTPIELGLLLTRELLLLICYYLTKHISITAYVI